MRFIELLLNGLEAGYLTDFEIQTTLQTLERQLPSHPSGQTALIKVIKDPELDARHKLKVSIPIIPLILDYEGELELGSGFNITGAWNWVKKRLKIGD